MSDVMIADAVEPGDLAAVRELMMEYGRALDFAICFKGFEREMADLPGTHLLARIGSEPAGIVAIAAAGADMCEMKRLFVRPAWRGRGLGRRLCEAALEAARAAGYTGMRLETLPSMAEAQALYRTLGFTPAPAGAAGAADGIIHLHKELHGESGA